MLQTVMQTESHNTQSVYSTVLSAEPTDSTADSQLNDRHTVTAS